MPETITGKIARKYMAHFLDSAFTATPTSLTGASWYRLGKDLEEFNVELNPDIEQGQNILGTNYFRHNGYEVSGDAEPYYAEVGDTLFAKLQTIVDTLAQGSQLRTMAAEVHLWEQGSATGTYKAYVQECYVVPSSYGGDTSGYQIPFTVHYTGEKLLADYTPASGSTEASIALVTPST